LAPVAAEIPLLLLTLAPEAAAPHDTARLAAAGVRLFAGHSEAQPADLAQHSAISGVTHLFNAMSQLQGRAPGLVGSVFASDHLFASIIADGVHGDPLNVQLAYRVLGPDRLFLVTDAMPPLGTDQQTFSIAGRLISRAEGRLTAVDGTLAGADIAMDQCVQRMITMAGASRADAIKMATLTPARALGLEGQIGAIRPGLRAGFTALDADLNARAVIIGDVCMVDRD
jgi:N-acetylglucosamine-6-phosphate deacetylase